MNRMAVFVIAALTTPVGAAHAVDHPQLREGLWKIQTQMIDNPGNKKSDGTVMQCRDHAFDKSADALARTVRGCTTISESLSGGHYSSETRCVIGSTVMVSKGNAIFHGDTATHSETHISYTPALYGTAEETMLQDQTYLGSCPAGCGPETGSPRTGPSRI
jgi:hypothetical protein